MSLAVRAAESGRLPDPLVRWGIRRLCQSRLAEQRRLWRRQPRALEELVEALRRGPLAIAQGAANEQHYEVPPAFFELVLGPWRKYSCCYWPASVQNLGEAEEAMLELTLERSGIEDGMTVLDLGCGWGSFTLWLGRRLPKCRVLAVSNSGPQGDFIRRRAADRGLEGIEVMTADVARLELERRFDRVVSIEMFEHFRNWGRLLEKVSHWLEPDGRLFTHVFCHRHYAYLYEDRGDGDWMARTFFTGGLMPSDDLFRHFSRHLRVERQWRISGRHYRRTLDAWLENLDRERREVLELFRDCYPVVVAERWIQRWRLFFMACSELFGYRDGEEWWVSHNLLRPA